MIRVYQTNSYSYNCLINSKEWLIFSVSGMPIEMEVHVDYVTMIEAGGWGSTNDHNEWHSE